VTERKPDNLVALHYQETGSYVVKGQEALAINPLDKWATRKILWQRDRIEALETMVKVFRGCVETGQLPEQGSRLHKLIHDLVGEREDD